MDKQPDLKDTCATCEFSFTADLGGGNLSRHCRRFPPVESQTMVPTAQLPVAQRLALGKDVQYVPATMSRFPQVQDAWTCGEHSENFEEEPGTDIQH